MARFLTAVLASLGMLCGCASTDVAAPIIDRSPASIAANRAQPKTAQIPAAVTPAAAPVTQASTASPAATPPPAVTEKPVPVASAPVTRPLEQPTIRPYREGDWRPEYYVVQKGDTLYSIALEFGQDYRDLAAWNNLADAAYIQIGQHLRLFAPGGASEAFTPEPVELPPASLSGQQQAAAPPKVVPMFVEPKARKLAYSKQALAELMNRPVAAKPAAVPVATVPPQAKPQPKSVQAGISALPDERLAWEWPTSGRISYAFGQGSNQKGVGIDGKLGQPVVASAPGKVVYSGSGLRGYGKLIIVKHNATYLSVYAHNSQLLVKEGQSVAQGQKIAEVGDSDSDRIGLHFEIRRLGKPIDPLTFLPERAS